MKKINTYFAIFAAILFFSFNSQNAFAQPSETPPEGTQCFTLIVKNNVDIKLMIIAGSKTYMWTKTSDGYEKDTLNQMIPLNKVTKTNNDTIKVFADIFFFQCGDNNENLKKLSIENPNFISELFCYRNSLKSLNVKHCSKLRVLSYFNNNISGSVDYSNLSKLEQIYCYNNKISSVNINACPLLSEIDCSGNLLSDCGLDSIFSQLPKRNGIEKGKIFIKTGTFSNPGTLGCKDTIASNKNWDVLDDEGGGNTIQIKNSTYTCALSSAIESIPQNINVEIFPNPLQDILNISCDENIISVTIYDVLGKIMFEKTSNIKCEKINVANFDSGIYMLNVKTKNNSFTKTVIK